MRTIVFASIVLFTAPLFAQKLAPLQAPQPTQAPPLQAPQKDELRLSAPVAQPQLFAAPAPLLATVQVPVTTLQTVATTQRVRVPVTTFQEVDVPTLSQVPVTTFATVAAPSAVNVNTVAIGKRKHCGGLLQLRSRSSSVTIVRTRG